MQLLASPAQQHNLLPLTTLTGAGLFSGIGGFELAMQRTGVRFVGTAEIDKFPSQILSRRFAGIPNYGDVRNVTAKSFREQPNILRCHRIR